jgi:hypothetical protein
MSPIQEGFQSVAKLFRNRREEFKNRPLERTIFLYKFVYFDWRTDGQWFSFALVLPFAMWAGNCASPHSNETFINPWL